MIKFWFLFNNVIFCTNGAFRFQPATDGYLDILFFSPVRIFKTEDKEENRSVSLKVNNQITYTNSGESFNFN